MKLLATLLMALSVGCAAETLSGIVVDVHDGDTIKLKSGKDVTKIRLAYIDAPELDQLYGYASKTSLMQLTRDKRVDATCHSKDRYGRHLCTLLVGSEDINAMQVKRGMAWAYLHYAPKGTPLKALQSEAMEGKRGLWAEPNPEAPWEYRRTSKETR
jgi:micrococcal nuclease